MTFSNSNCLSIERAMEFIGDQDGLLNLLATLQDTLKQDLPEIQSLLDQGDLSGMNRLLHQFKGFAPVFCVADLVDQIVLVEGLSKKTDLQAVRDAYAPLAPRLKQLLAEVQAHLAKATG
jgi:HPt (histidine-containing phosphotransfer) domain-containing protein